MDRMQMYAKQLQALQIIYRLGPYVSNVDVGGGGDVCNTYHTSINYAQHRQKLHINTLYTRHYRLIARFDNKSESM